MRSPGFAASTAAWIVGYWSGTARVWPGVVGGGSRPGPTAPPDVEGNVAFPTRITPAMPIPPAAPWYRQKYANTADWEKVIENVWPGARFPESFDPSSAVTVCGLRPVLSHSMVV